MDKSQSNRKVSFNEVAWVAAGTILAVFLNLNPISLVAGAEVVFGNIIAVAIVIRCGLAAGIFTSICASLAVSTMWGHYLAILPNILEVLIVHTAIRNKQHPIIYGITYWMTLGALIVFVSYEYFSDFAEYTKHAITLKYIINGMLTTSIGYIAQLAISNRGSTRNPFVYFTFKQVITFVTFITVLLGVCLNAYFWLSETKKIKLENVNSQLEMSAIYSSREIENYVGNTLEQVSLSAKQFSLMNIQPNQAMLNEIAQSNLGILTMLVSDANGFILTTYPKDLLEMVKGSDENVSDRQYFTSVKASNTPFISDVFQGRGFGNDPIVALSAPLVINDSFNGILQASLSLGYFETLDRKQIDLSQGLVILDAQNRVIYSSAELGFEYLQNLTDSNLIEHLKNPESAYYVDPKDNDYFVKSNRLENFGWQSISFLPRAVYEQKVLNLFTTALLLLIGFIVVAMLIGTVVSQRLSHPVQHLSASIVKASSSGEFEKINIRSDSAISEVNALTDSINEFSSKYRDTLDSLKEAVEETNDANAKLGEINANLEKIIERKTQDIMLALEKANQASEAKSAFLANMSHEIRTPLNSIYGTLQILQSRFAISNEKNELLDQAIFSARTLSTILNDILDFSKIEAGELQLELIPFNLVSLINNVMSEYSRKAEEKGIELVQVLDKDCPKFWLGDPVRVRQIMANLVSNATKFTESGEVKLSAFLKQQGHNTFLQIQVVDTGIGMTQESVKHLFERFTQADVSTTRKYGGTGLGMAITRRLVNMMNGRIQCDSKFGEGTQFTIELSLNPIDDVIENDNKELSTDKLPDLSKLKLVYVEDNEINIVVFRTMLEGANAKLFVAKNGEQGVELCRRLKPDLVFMDIHMPVMDGVEATKILRKEMPELIIIAATANVMKTDVESYFRAGFNGYIAKPLELAQLRQVLVDNLDTVST